MDQIMWHSDDIGIVAEFHGYELSVDLRPGSCTWYVFKDNYTVNEGEEKSAILAVRAVEEYAQKLNTEWQPAKHLPCGTQRMYNGYKLRVFLTDCWVFTVSGGVSINGNAESEQDAREKAMKYAEVE